MPGYEVVERNYKMGQEGLMLAVRKGTFHSLEEVTKTNLRNILTVRIQYKQDTARAIVLHAPQETDSVDIRTEFF